MLLLIINHCTCVDMICWKGWYTLHIPVNNYILWFLRLSAEVQTTYTYAIWIFNEINNSTIKMFLNPKREYLENFKTAFFRFTLLFWKFNDMEVGTNDIQRSKYTNGIIIWVGLHVFYLNIILYTCTQAWNIVQR